MRLEQRIELFSALGKRMTSISENEFDEIAVRAHGENNWFTEKSIKTAFEGILKHLDKEALTKWASKYALEPSNAKLVGVVMAGNIPLVGFHDLLSVVISGHRLAIKPSSNDTVLLKWVVNELIQLEPNIGELVRFEDRLNDVDAIIATGSDNTARYFEYYFSKKPHIIRKNRTSCAVLKGGESPSQVMGLGQDIFTYFGLGCRNVSKLFVPRDFNFQQLLDGLHEFENVMDHHKYKNNYDYNKSIYLVNNEPHLDTGFLLLRESEALVSPISVLFYEYYNSESHLEEMLEVNSEKIQCVVGSGNSFETLGQAQFPAVTDYADGIDTLKFLSALN